MPASVYSFICRHTSPAADDVLLEALRRGHAREQSAAVEALLQRNTSHGLAGLIACFSQLPTPLQRRLVKAASILAPAVGECARSDSDAARVSAARFLGMARDPGLVCLLGDLVRSAVPEVSDAACQALEQLATWIASTADDLRAGRVDASSAGALATHLLDLRPEVENLLARALASWNGPDSPSLAHGAALLLENRRGPLFDAWKRQNGPGWPMVSARLARPSDRAVVASALAAAGRPGQRSDLTELFAWLDQSGPLDGLLDHAHWLADPSLAAAAGQVDEGAWWSPAALQADLDRRALVTQSGQIQQDSRAICSLARWICASGAGPALVEELLGVLLDRQPEAPTARLRLLLAAEAHPHSPPLQLLTRLLADPDERIARMATRALARHASPAAQRTLIRHAAGAPDGVRAIISRRIGARSFLTYWQRFPAMSKKTRTATGKALVKLLPDSLSRLQARLQSGPAPDRIKALCIVAELGIALQVREAIYACCEHPDPHVRSKAVLMLGQVLAAGASQERAERQLEAALVDADARVRANAIEVLERTARKELLPLLEARSRLGRNRERANAIKAMAGMGLADPQRPLFDMLRDGRKPHRLSALWAVEQTGQWKLLDEVVRLARGDEDEQVRRSAVGAVQRLATRMRRPAA